MATPPAAELGQQNDRLAADQANLADAGTRKSSLRTVSESRLVTIVPTWEPGFNALPSATPSARVKMPLTGATMTRSRDVP